MKATSLLFILLTINGCTKEMPKKITHPPQTIQSFQEVWSEVTSDPLTTLPQNKVTFGKLFTFSKNIILGDAQRTLADHRDIIEPFDKLAHPNGVCLKGIWQIHKANPYSGYFKKDSKALIIVRASTALSDTKRGDIRAFGFAGKLFPTTSPTQINKEHTANFFAIDDLGGTDALHYTDVAMTNEPSVTTTSAVIKNILYALKIAKAFSDTDSHSGIRQLYEISELGEKDKNIIITPKWIKISAQKGQTVDAKDFREEFRLTQGQKIRFDIAVASKEVDEKKVWQTIGTIT
ncbi:MAG: hypothetical protein L3J43_11245, partial [Sulfurovum sp.]|nr:hypothetical protein [Sulfurovum sp.]